MIQRGEGYAFPVAQWGAAVLRVSRGLKAALGPVTRGLLSKLGSAADPQRRLLTADNGSYVDQAMPSVSKAFPARAVAEARRRLNQRSLDADFVDGCFARRRPRWRRDEGRQHGVVPVIDVDEAENVIAHLLAVTWPEALFSYTPRKANRVFAGGCRGYHRDEQQRVYVSGLSEVLDTMNEAVQHHREWKGGRVLVADGRVICADCRAVLAWIGTRDDLRAVPPSH